MGVCSSSVLSHVASSDLRRSHGRHRLECTDSPGGRGRQKTVRMPDGRAVAGGCHEEDGEEGPPAHPDTAHLMQPWTGPGGSGGQPSSPSASPSPSPSPPWAAATGMRGPGRWQSHCAGTTRENCPAFTSPGTAGGTTGARLSSTFGRRGTTSSSSAGSTWGSGSPARRASAAQVSAACRVSG